MSLKLILGCMFSGKSTEIIRIINRLDTINVKYLLIKPQIDKRYSSNMVCTHNFMQRGCTSCRDLLPLLETEDYHNSDYIIIEEAQFFQDLEPFILKSVDDDKKNVIVVGLDGDSNRNNFGDIHKIIPLCDNIIKLKALCTYCKNGKDAIFSKRICNDKQQLCIGSNDKYVAVCRECFLI